MTKRTAIKRIREQKQLLLEPQGDLWLIAMSAYLDRIFGKDSEEYKSLNVNVKHLDIQSADYDGNIAKLNKLCDAWIGHIQKGLMKVQEETIFEKRMYSVLAGMGGGLITIVVQNVKGIIEWISSVLHQ